MDTPLATAMQARVEWRSAVVLVAERAFLCALREILRASAFGRHFALDRQAGQVSFNTRCRSVLVPVVPVWVRCRSDHSVT